MWKITFYDGTVWTTKSDMSILDAIKKALERTGFNLVSIKEVINLN